MNNELLTTAEAAQYLGKILGRDTVHIETVRRHVKHGNLKPARDLSGRGYLFTASSLDELAKTQNMTPGAPKTKK